MLGRVGSVGYAPVSLITIGPEPPGSGSGELTVTEGEGPKFSAAPWKGLVWPTNDIPQLGVNACEIEVNNVNGDVLSFDRDDPTIDIHAGLQVAEIQAIPLHGIGGSITLSAVFASASGPYTALLRSPSGSLSSPAAVDGGAGSAWYGFAPNRSGTWAFQFEDSLGDRSPEQEFFVPFVGTE